jgi:superfamily II DNA or RNA helicase
MSLIEALFPYSWEILFLKYGIENYHSQLGLMIEHAITQVLNRIKERIETQVLPDYYYRKVIQACERLLNKNPSATIYCQVIVLLYHEKIQAFHTRFFDDKQFLQKFLKIATVEFLLKKKSELCSTSLYNFLMTTLDRDNIPNLLVPIGTVRSHKIFNYIKNQDLKKYRELCILRYCYLHRYEISKKNDPDISVDLITKKLSDINPDSDNADLIDKIFYILEQISPVKHIARLLREYITLLTSNSLNARSTFTPEHLYDICLENPHAVTDIIQELCSLPINFSLYVLEPQWRTIIDSIREENDLSDNQEDILSKIAAFYNHSEVRLVIENPKDTRLRLGIDDNLDYEAVFDSGSDDLIDIDTDSSSQSLEPPVPPAERPVVVIESINFAQETVESIRERCAESLIQSADIFFGIHQKYSQDKTVPCVPEHIKSYNKRANKKSEKAILQKVTVLFEKIMEKTRNSDSYGRSEQNVQHEGYRLLLSGQLNKKLPAIVVFAGRKDEATLPPSQQAEVFIVMTQSEYDSLSKECRSNVYSQGYHFLIIDTLWVADAQMGLVFSSDKPDDIGKLTARRRLALLLGYDEGFNDLIMLDDNLKSVSCINSSQEPVDDNWTFVLNQFIEKSHQANSVLTTVQTESFKTIQKQRAKERIGWKMIYVNISLLRPLFERRQLYFLFPINLKASSEDAFFQILVHVSSQRSAPPAKGYVRFDVEEFSLCRIPHKKGRLSNICRQSGVYAQELSLQSADNQSLEPLALSILGQEKFDNLQIALCLFNNNITLNQVIRSASNLQRENYDILEALAKEELSQTDEEQWLPPVEATGFSDIVTAMADNPGFRLRDPQKECLQAIAQLSSKNDKMAVSSLPTGVGKTRIQAFTAFAYYLQHHKNSHVIVVAPTRVLSSQIVDDFLTEGNALGPEYRRHLLAVYSGAPIGQNKRVVDLPFLMANKRFREEHRGTIIVFCQASFKSLLNMAAKSGEQYHNEAKIFLRRVQMLIFDEEHLTYDPNYSAIKQLRDNDTFRSLDYVLGFSATSPIQEEYASSTLDKRAQESERRELIYLYTKNQAQDAGYIRRDRETSTTTSSIFDLIQNYPYDNNTALNEHVGIILCESQEQLEQIEQELQENIRDRQLRLQCYSVYSKKKDYSTQLANFSQTTDRSVCLVIKMLQEGYNHPAARYIINLKKYVSKRSKEQYGGRIRRKMAPNDPYTALWINVTLTDVNKKTNNVQDIDEEYYYDDDNSYCQSLDIDGPEDFEDDLNQNSNDNSGEINNTDSFDLEERPLKQLRLSAQTIDLTADEHSSSSSSSSQFKRQNKRFFVDEHTVSESPPKRCRLEERESDEEAMDVADQTEFRFSGAQIAPASNTLSQSVRQISRPDNQLEEGEIDEEAMDVADQTELRFSGAQIAPASNTLSQSVRQISRPDNQLEEGEIDEEAMDVAEQIEPTVTTAQILPAEPSAISTLHTSEQSNQADLIERALNAPNLPAGWGIAVRSRLQSQKKH